MSRERNTRLVTLFVLLRQTRIDVDLLVPHRKVWQLTCCRSCQWRHHFDNNKRNSNHAKWQQEHWKWSGKNDDMNQWCPHAFNMIISETLCVLFSPFFSLSLSTLSRDPFIFFGVRYCQLVGIEIICIRALFIIILIVCNMIFIFHSHSSHLDRIHSTKCWMQ